MTLDRQEWQTVPSPGLPTRRHFTPSCLPPTLLRILLWRKSCPVSIHMITTIISFTYFFCNLSSFMRWWGDALNTKWQWSSQLRYDYKTPGESRASRSRGHSGGDAGSQSHFRRPPRAPQRAEDGPLCARKAAPRLHRAPGRRRHTAAVSVP